MSRTEYNEKLRQAVTESTRRTLRRLWITMMVVVGGWGVMIALAA